jgi:hypothetical protein
VPALPPLHAMQHTNGGGTEGAGACKRQFACPCPLLLHAPCLAPPLLPFCARGSRHPGSAQMGNAGRRVKGTPHPHFRPSPPLSCQNSACSPPAPVCAPTGHGNTGMQHHPLPLASHSCTHTSERCTQAGGGWGWFPFPPLPSLLHLR